MDGEGALEAVNKPLLSVRVGASLGALSDSRFARRGAGPGHEPASNPRIELIRAWGMAHRFRGTEAGDGAVATD
jgi:hypothetical protein